MTDDFWSDEKFEDAITRSMIALYESKLSTTGPSAVKMTDADWVRIQRNGVYVPAPGRLIASQGIDGRDGVPTSGCISFAGWPTQVGERDNMQSYCRIVEFRRRPAFPRRLPRYPGIPYELCSLWPQSEGDVEHGKFTYSLGRDGASRVCYVDVAGTTIDMWLHMAMQYVADARHTWCITTDDGHRRVSVGAYSESVKSLLYARELPMTAAGRKRPILHLVHAHKRRMREGTSIDIGQFLRGTREVVMGGTRFTVSAPQRLIDEMEK